MDGWTYGDVAQNPAPSSATNGIENVTYVYYKDETCSTQTTTADGAEGNGGVPKNAGTYWVQATFPATQNYKATTAKVKFIIAKKELTPTATANNKIYDGNTKGTGSISLSGIVSGDKVTATASSYTFAKKDVGTGIEVTVSGITISNTANYTCVASVKTTANITKRTITPSTTVNNKTYDGNATGSGTVSIEGQVTGENPDVTATYAFEDKNVGTGKNVTVKYTLGSSWTNYQLEKSSETKTADITAATLTAKYVGETITYGETPKLAITVTGFVNGEDQSKAEGYKAPTLTTTEKNVGTHKLTPSGGSATNYSFEYVAGNLEITKAPLTVTFTADSKTTTYTGSAVNIEKTYTKNISGLKNGDAENVVSITGTATYTYSATGYSSQTTPTNAGEYTITLSGLSASASNYDIKITFNTGKLTINKANRTITPASTTVYVGKNAEKTVTFTYTGEDVTATTTSASDTTATASMSDEASKGTVTITGKAAGTTSVTISVGESTNYNAISATVNVTVTDISISAGATKIGKGTTTVTPTISPTNVLDEGKKINWTTSNEDYATINTTSTTGTGVTVTGVSTGIVTITAELNGQKATVQITVDATPPTVTITRTAYNTFTYSASDDNGIDSYAVTTTNTAPTVATEWKAEVSAQTINQSNETTYYVWAKDKYGNVGSANIKTYKVTANAGANTTITLRENTSSGTQLASTIYVTDGTKIYITSTASTGYNTPTLTVAGKSATNPNTATINATTTITSSATPNTYKINYSLNGGSAGTKAPTTATYDQNIEISNPAKSGLGFAGWTTSTTNGLGSNAKAGLTADNMESWNGSNMTNTFFKNLTDTNNGTVTLTANWGRATFDTGENVNVKMKQLSSGNNEAKYRDWDTTIKTLQYSDTMTSENAKVAKVVSAPESQVPIYMWYKDGTIYWHSSDKKPFLNENSSYMFSELTELLTLDVTVFDTSKVTNMSFIFEGCRSITKLDVSGIDTSKVTDMSFMFAACKSLTNLDVSGFKTDEVTTMDNMFDGCESLTKLDVSRFNTEKVTNMRCMFCGCLKIKTLDITKFNTSKVTSMHRMFRACTELTELNVLNLDTRKVEDMAEMFAFCNNLTQLDVSNFKTSSVTNMVGMFVNCTKLKSLDLSMFDTRNLKSMESMFSGCETLTELNLSNFNTSNVIYMSRARTGSGGLDHLHGNLDYGKYVKDFEAGMFVNCKNLVTLDLSSFDTNKVAYMNRMFYGCSKLETIYIGPHWSTDSVKEGKEMFKECVVLKGSNDTMYDSSHVDFDYAHIDNAPSNPGYLTSGAAVFDTTKLRSKMSSLSKNKKIRYIIRYRAEEISTADKVEENKISSSTSAFPIYMWSVYINGSYEICWWCEKEKVYLDNCNSLFSGYTDAEIIDLSGVDASGATDMTAMFANCRSLTTLNLSGFNTSGATNMTAMFNSCSSLTTLDLSGFDTKNVTTMSNMFASCSSLTTLDLSGFDTKNVTNMTNMFAGCRSLTALNLSGFNTSGATDMPYMFAGCSSLTTLDLSSFDTRNVTTMLNMFNSCSSLTTLDLSSFDTRNVTTMYYMFVWCSKLKTIYVGNNWSTSKLTTKEVMFGGCDVLKGGQGTTYNNIDVYSDYAHIDGGTSNPGFFTQGPAPASIANYLSSNSVSISSVEQASEDEIQGDIETEKTIENNDEQQIPIDEMPDLAEVGEIKYKTIEEAIMSCNDEGSIKVLENVSLDKELVIQQGKNITINLNGKTITSTSTNTINNQGTLTITGSGIIKNEVENGTVIYNIGTVNMENVVITTEKNGGKCVYNITNMATFNMNSGKIVTQGIGAIGIYNAESSKTNIKDGIVEITGVGSKAIYNDSILEITNGKVIVSEDDGIGIYNSKKSKECIIKSIDITVKAKNIENYELIKDTKEFKEELEQMKPSYGIYNESENPLEIEKATVKVERIKSVGIRNEGKGVINLGKDDEELSTSLPIIYAIADNTTAIMNSEEGNINFYDGKILTTSSVRNIITKVLDNYEIFEQINSKFIDITLRLTNNKSKEQVEENNNEPSNTVEGSHDESAEEKQNTEENDVTETDETSEAKTVMNEATKDNELNNEGSKDEGSKDEVSKDEISSDKDSNDKASNNTTEN